MLEIVYIRKGDGVTVKGLAFYSYRCGPIGEWTYNGKPLSEIDGDVISMQPWQGFSLNQNSHNG